MCYSALVRQNLTWLAKRYGAEIAWELFEELYRRRLGGEGIQLSRSLDVSVLQMQDPQAARSQALIEQYRSHRATEWEQELFKQRARLADAQHKLSTKLTKTAQEEERKASKNIADLTHRLTHLRNIDAAPADTRIFSKYYAPVIAYEGDQLLIRPMRYLCRPRGMPASVDRDYPGTYNARRDNLEGNYWRGLFSQSHGIIVMEGFFEWVDQHRYEGRALQAGEKSKRVELKFNPSGTVATPMTVACLWSHWQSPSEPDLYSFAAITDEPPAEVAQAGHDRCVVVLKDEHVREWLSPHTVSTERLQQMMDDHNRPISNIGSPRRRFGVGPGERRPITKTGRPVPPAGYSNSGRRKRENQ